VTRRGWLLGFALAGVLLAAVDTYVIVLALPAIMADVGVSLDRLQQATPIISGFLLGYVVVMPLIGRLSDVYGRYPLLVFCLAVFAAGSLVTASAHDLGSAVAGRALQGLGGGGLVPVTLALVADLWPARRRGVPLGVVGAVQELGSVVGPLYGGLILAVASWQTIFWLNLPLVAVIAAGILAARGRAGAGALKRRRPSPSGVATMTAASLAVISGGLAIAAPQPLRDSASIGALYTPIAGPQWFTPLFGLAVMAAIVSIVLWWVARTATRGWRAAATLGRRADWVGAVLMALVLTCVVLSFASGDPGRDVISPSAWWLLPAGGVLAVLFVVRELRAPAPLVAFAEFKHRAAAGALLANLAIGAALMAALVDVPLFARLTAFSDSQLSAALVLLRLLIGLPAGAFAGGLLCQRLGNRFVAGAGMAITAVALAVMTRWSATTLTDPLGVTWLHPSDPVLVACGFGFGLTIAPINAAILAAVRPAFHGLAGALVVVARIVGMLIGISVLTAVGLHVFFASTAALPPPQSLCPHSPLNCGPYNSLVQAAAIDELRTVFLGAAVCAGLAALVAAWLLGKGAGDNAPLAHA
jgi:MFS transporter, DHA2 family, triacylglyceride efflux pump